MLVRYTTFRNNSHIKVHDAYMSIYILQIGMYETEYKKIINIIWHLYL